MSTSAELLAEPVIFVDVSDVAEFKVDLNARTVTGLAVPWGVAASNGWAVWRFIKGSLSWSDPKRVKLLINHDAGQAIGFATTIKSTDQGLVATFKIARGDEGDRALILAEDGVLDGLSVGVQFNDPNSFEINEDDGARDVIKGSLREVSLTPMPAFDDARVASVKASLAQFQKSTTNHEGQAAMGAENTPETAAPVAPVNINFNTAELADAIKAGNAELVETLSAKLAEAVKRPTDEAIEEGRGASPAPRFTVVREAPIYALDGRGHSFVRDAWKARTERDDEATDRLRKYQEQTAENARRVHWSAGQAVRGAQFTGSPVDTSGASEVIPPGYRPDLYVAEVPQGRPLVDSFSRGSISDATPFTIPVFVSASGAAGSHSEGVSDDLGSLELDTVTVTPKVRSGKFQVTRELVDSSNPAVDAIALAAMREAYVRVTEADVAALLETAAGSDSDSDGISDAGVYLETVSGTDGADFVFAVRDAMAKYPFRRFAALNRLALARQGYVASANAKDDVNRPLLPSAGVQNGLGSAGAAVASLNFDGIEGRPAWALNSAVQDAYLWNAIDTWVWESTLLTFRFEEKAGPEAIELAIWSYFGTQIVRPSGITAVSFVDGTESSSS